MKPIALGTTRSWDPAFVLDMSGINGKENPLNMFGEPYLAPANRYHMRLNSFMITDDYCRTKCEIYIYSDI